MEYLYDHGAPWEEFDGHWIVTEWERRDHWFYCGIDITLLDDEGECDTLYSQSLYGIESDCYEYHFTIIQDLIYEIDADESRQSNPVAMHEILRRT